MLLLGCSQSSIFHLFSRPLSKISIELRREAQIQEFKNVGFGVVVGLVHNEVEAILDSSVNVVLIEEEVLSQFAEWTLTANNQQITFQ